MGHIDRRGDELRKKLNEAIDKDRSTGVIEILGKLEEHEPKEPRWPQRLGDALKRAGRLEDAEVAYVRAMHRFAEEGFLPQAVALGKVIVALNPARLDLLDQIDQRATRELRDASPYGVAATAVAIPGVRRAGGREPAPAEPAAASGARRGAEPSVLDGVVQGGMAGAARPLERAGDAAPDEVRFVDVPPEDSVVIDVSDLDAMAVADLELELSETLQPGRPDERMDAERLAQLSAAALFADVSRAALGKLARAAHLQELRAGDYVCRKGADADALFVIVDGSAHVVLPWLEAGGVALAAGQVFGESCLLDEGTRQADVRALGSLLLLRIAEEDLRRIAAEFSHVREVLFDLLVKRLVTNTLQTSSLFSAFAPTQRKELARMFEVRLAPAGCALQQAGKRSDGLYLLLAGSFGIEQAGALASLPLATLIGHRSLLSRAVAERTVMARSESVVLRLPAARFSQFAMQYPPALAHLSDLAAQPLLA